MNIGSQVINDLIGKSRTLYEEAIAVYANPVATAEDLAAAKQKQQDANAIKARANDLLQLHEEAQALPNLEDLKSGFSGGAARPPSEKFANFEDFIGAVAVRALHGKTDPRLKGFRDKDEDAAESRKDMSGGVGAAGGVLIPIEQYGELLAVAAPFSIVRPRATKIRMRRRQVTIPALDQSGAVAGVPSFYGGIRVFWAEEASLKPNSDPAFRLITLTAHKLVGYTRASDELLDDAESLADYLGGPMGFPGAIAWAEDYAFLRGSGVGQPLGILNSPATLAITRNTSGKITYDDVAKMLGRFMGTNPVWVASITAKEALLLMHGPNDTGYAGAYMWGDASKGVPEQLMGYPIFFTDKLPATGTLGDLMLCDWSQYIIGDRQATTFETTRVERFQYDQTSFRAVHRVDGTPWLNAPLTLVDGTTQVSPFVAIAT